MTKLILASLMTMVLFSGCQTSSQEKLEDLDKKSAREVTLLTVTQGEKVFHITKQNIWVNGQKIAEKTDTITTALKENTWDTAEGTTPLNEIPIYVTVQ